MSQQDRTRNNKRTYIQVEDDRRDSFIQVMIENPNEEIKQAALITGIKSPRATALWRKNKNFIETRR